MRRSLCGVKAHGHPEKLPPPYDAIKLVNVGVTFRERQRRLQPARCSLRSSTVNEKSHKYDFLVQTLEETVAEASPGNCAVLIGELERCKAVLYQKMFCQSPSAPSACQIEEALLDLPGAARLLNIPLSRARELSRRRDGFPVIRIGRCIRRQGGRRSGSCLPFHASRSAGQARPNLGADRGG